MNDLTGMNTTSESQEPYQDEENVYDDESEQSSSETTQLYQQDITEPQLEKYHAYREDAQERFLMQLREQITQHMDAWRSMQKRMQ